jgi:methionyl aminopeptidase
MRWARMGLGKAGPARAADEKDRMAIHLRSAEELQKMHRAGLIVYEVLTALRSAVKPGMTTMDLEKLAEEKLAGKPGHAAFKGYRGYPCMLCTSVNSEIVHGIPSPKRKLREGDIVSIDFGMEVDGYYADSAVTVPLGKVRPEVQKLLDVTRESLDRAIDKMRAGNRLGDVGHAVQSWVEQNGFSVVREFVGHGIGTRMHDEPNLPNYGEEGRGARLQEGMVIAVEPMVNAGCPDVRMLDEWTAQTADGSPSAHFEHTVAVTANGPWILTRPKEVTGPSW